MIRITRVTSFVSGTPQFRIEEDMSARAPLYAFYTQSDLEGDLKGMASPNVARKQVRTFDSVITASTGDVVFSLLSGTAALVRAEHSGYLLTQNYVVLVPSRAIDASYLVYLLNENSDVRRQLRMGQQGSSTQKFSIRQLRALELPALPSHEKQKLIGGLYLSQIRLHALRKRASDLETALVLEAIREADHS